VRKPAVVFAVLIALPSVLAAQNPLVVRGTVLDSAGRPIESVEVSAVMVGRVTRTNADGHFQIDTVTPGPSRLLIRRLGWQAIDTTFMLDPKNPRELRFVMSRVVQSLDEIRVVSHDDCPIRTMEGFDCRRRAGLGAFRDSAEIAALKPVCAADIVYGMEGLRRVPGSPCPRFVPTTGWRCLRVLVDGKVTSNANGPPALMTDYIGVEFYADYDHVPEWYKQFAFAGATQGVPTHQSAPGRAMIYRQPSQSGRDCSLLVYWTHFAPRFDPKLDQNAAATRAMQARRDSIAARQKAIVDSLAAAKKP
jgi:hypothetical protein